MISVKVINKYLHFSLSLPFNYKIYIICLYYSCSILSLISSARISQKKQFVLFTIILNTNFIYSHSLHFKSHINPLFLICLIQYRLRIHLQAGIVFSSCATHVYSTYDPYFSSSSILNCMLINESSC